MWSVFAVHLFNQPGSSGLFNPYSDWAEDLDHPEAVTLRQTNLRNYLTCYVEPPPVFLLAEAPGPWGCRFSGVPLVSEAQLVDPAFPIAGHPSSLAETPHHEYSAKIYWRVMQPYFPHFFTWNSVPFHPYKGDERLSIRNPSNREVASFAPLLQALLDLLQPQHVVAIGRKAEYGLQKIGIDATYVRHPSQGGAKLFETGVTAIFQEIGLAKGA